MGISVFDQPRHAVRTAGSTKVQAIAALAAVVFVSTVIMQTSRAAFTATTDNTTNNFAGGTLALADDDTGSALFNVSDLVPGDSVQRCITVTYTGSITASIGDVRLYSSGYTDTGNFADYLDLVIDQGTGGSYADCTGFTLGSNLVTSTLTAFDTASSNYATGVSAFTPSTSPEARTYRVTATLNAATPDAEQGETVTGLVFTWEIQST